MTAWSPRARRWTVGITVGTIALTALIWFVVGYYYDSWNVLLRAVTRHFFVRQMFPDWSPLHWTPFTYLVLSAIFASAIFFARNRYEEVKDRGRFGYSYNYGQYRWTTRTSMGSRILVIALAVLTLFSTGYAVTGWWNNDKDQARSYADANVFYVEDADSIPASLVPLTQGATPTEGEDCRFDTVHDVDACVNEGTLPANWDARSASLTGANIIMSRTSGAVPNTDIMEETLTYLYAGDGDGIWSTIRNGVNKQPVNSIVTWDGNNATQSCRFTGKYALNYAFGGRWGQNLDDTLAREYPGLLYAHDDMWGYCRGSGEVSSREPVIVIPVTQQESYSRRTTLRSAGVLIITGSSQGEPQIKHQQTVEAGELPGPAYPITLVAKQREMLQWSAGRANKNRLNFGYEPSTTATQAGNASEYLLRSKDDGRLYWVTPLTPRSSQSQLLVAYSITPADETQAGDLNTQAVYVLPDEDPRIVNMDDMEARVSQAIRESNPGFFTGDKPGRISEFLPIDEDTWQAFAELNGRVVYRVEVPANTRISPTVEALDESVEPPAEGGNTSFCTKDPKELEPQQLADCIKQFADELAGRN